MLLHHRTAKKGFHISPSFTTKHISGEAVEETGMQKTVVTHAHLYRLPVYFSFILGKSQRKSAPASCRSLTLPSARLKRHSCRVLSRVDSESSGARASGMNSFQFRPGGGFRRGDFCLNACRTTSSPSGRKAERQKGRKACSQNMCISQPRNRSPLHPPCLPSVTHVTWGG